jgi:hypothetical protein
MGRIAMNKGFDAVTHLYPRIIRADQYGNILYDKPIPLTE